MTRVRKPRTGKPNVLGDIVNSSLVRVKGGLCASAADKLGSTAYAALPRNRLPRRCCVGANDGMLATDAASGEEFAFIGREDRRPVLEGRGRRPHRYFVDGMPVVSDVYFATPGTGCWSAAWARARQVFADAWTPPPGCGARG